MRKGLNLTVSRLHGLFQSDRLSPVDLIQYCHKLASLNACNEFSIVNNFDQVLHLARLSQERFRSNRPLSLLDGIPVSLKANIAASDFPLTASSDMLSTLQGYDSKLVQRLKQAGCIVIGQTNMDEFGMGSLGTLSNRGIVRNPFDDCLSNRLAVSKADEMDLEAQDDVQHFIQHIKSCDASCSYNISAAGATFKATGGSSSGSAASVAIGSSILSIGTDTGGSVRLPAAWCGVVGLKPTYGSISRHGVVSYASSLDTVGILGRSVECVSLGFDVIKNSTDRQDHDLVQRDESQHKDSIPLIAQKKYSTYETDIGDSTACSVTNMLSKSDSKSPPLDPLLPLKDITIGIPEAFSIQGTCTSILEQWDKASTLLEQQGAVIKSISSTLVSPNLVRLCIPAYYVLTCAEASSNLTRYDGLRFGYDDTNPMVHGLLSSSSSSRESKYSNCRRPFGAEVKRRILAGTAVLSSDRFHSHYEAALKCRAAITLQLHKLFDDKQCDVIVIPTTVGGPPIFMKDNRNESPSMDFYANDLPASSTEIDGTAAFQNDIMTVPISLAGLPSVSIPMKLEDALTGISKSGTLDPSSSSTSNKLSHGVVGLQIIGPRMGEGVILKIARILESEAS